MLGFYPNFPEYFHTVTQAISIISIKRLQQILINVLYELNQSQANFDLNLDSSVNNCKVIFEFGAAEGENFNYLDAAETERIVKAACEKPFKVLDFFCAVRYYKVEGSEGKPLKFDYYMLRMLFDGNLMEIRVFHERGPRRLAPEELASFIIRKVNEKASRKILKPP